MGQICEAVIMIKMNGARDWGRSASYGQSKEKTVMWQEIKKG